MVKVPLYCFKCGKFIEMVEVNNGFKGNALFTLCDECKGAKSNE